MLIEMRATLNEINAKLDSQNGASPPPAPEPRAWYSVDEVAALLSKSRYTVREWCRNGQIKAAKRAERRGAAALWSISAEEVTRYRNEGLLPIDPDRNNVN
jgi:excisionase family DNA binding protein